MVKNERGSTSIKLVADLCTTGVICDHHEERTEEELQEIDEILKIKCTRNVLPKASTKASTKNIDKPIGCTIVEICELIRDTGGELYAGELRSQFQLKFGKDPFVNGASVTKTLQQLSLSGEFKVENRGQ